MQITPATVSNDCAPWDGAAFTLRVPIETGAEIDISIWQKPDIKFPVTFSFPDNTGRVGTAVRRMGDAYEQMNGKVSFSHVNGESPVEGEFDFRNDNGEQYKGTFTAAWNDQVVMCG